MSHFLKDFEPAFIDLFAGCGGLSLGLEKAEFKCKNWENLAQGPWREQVIENKIKTVEDFLNNEVIKGRYEEYKEIIDKQINSKYGEEFFDIISRILFVKEQVESPRRS